MRTYYWTCSECGANLDPGEKCDCDKEKAEETAISTAKNKNYNNQIINQEVMRCQI